MTQTVTLHPGSVALADWARVYFGAQITLDQDCRAAIEAGKSADLAIWDIERPAELVYRMGFNPLHARIWRGQ